MLKPSDMKMFLALGFSVLTVLLICSGLTAGPSSASQEDSSPRILGQPGFLVIEAARDSMAPFKWDELVAGSPCTLNWDQGKLILPDTLLSESFGSKDLGVAFSSQLSGSGESGQLVLRDGIYPVSEPVILSDGVLELHLSGGELEIRGSRILYRRAPAEDPERRAGFLLLGGMMLLVIVLLRRARLKVEERNRT